MQAVLKSVCSRNWDIGSSHAFEDALSEKTTECSQLEARLDGDCCRGNKLDPMQVARMQSPRMQPARLQPLSCPTNLFTKYLLEQGEMSDISHALENANILKSIGVYKQT